MNLLLSRLEELEALFRRYYSTFERRHQIVTVADATDYISVLEKAKVFLLYPDDPFVQDKDLKKHVGERLKEFYHFSAGSRNE